MHCSSAPVLLHIQIWVILDLIFPFFITSSATVNQARAVKKSYYLLENLVLSISAVIRSPFHCDMSFYAPVKLASSLCDFHAVIDSLPWLFQVHRCFWIRLYLLSFRLFRFLFMLILFTRIAVIREKPNLRVHENMPCLCIKPHSLRPDP